MTDPNDGISRLAYKMLYRAHRQLAANPSDRPRRERFDKLCEIAGRRLGHAGPIAAVEINGVELRSSVK